MIKIIEKNTQKNKRPSTNLFLTYFNKLSNTFTQIIDDPKKHNILYVIQNLNNNTKHIFSILNEKFIINIYLIQSSNITNSFLKLLF